VQDFKSQDFNAQDLNAQDLNAQDLTSQAFQSIGAELEDLLKLESLTEPDLVRLKTQLCSRLETLTEDLAKQLDLLPYCVEIKKQLRLLSADLLNHKAARQPEKRSLRQSQILERLKLLLGYCRSLEQLV
jgi:hypothetical protein